ncbi:MAG: hypothetical protein LBR69_01970 [Endomicrobium sp.]|jgi:hypothetical protein|nr:hypothetical protein [Endomicrobium sp.]
MPAAVEFFNEKKAVVLFFALAFFGLLNAVLQFCVSYVPVTELIDPLPGAYAWYFPEKMRYFSVYLALLPVTLVFAGVFFYFYGFNKKYSDLFKSKDAKFKFYFFLFFAAANFALLIDFNAFTKSAVWLVLLFTPFINYGFIYEKISAIPTKITDKVSFYALLIFSVFFLFIFAPLVFSPPKIINEYLNIPEQTKLKDGSIVDNFGYINEIGLWGYHKRFDFRKDEDIYSGNSVYLSDTDAVKTFVSLKAITEKDIQKINNLTDASVLPVYFMAGERLAVTGVFPESDLGILMQIAVNNEEKESLLKLYEKMNREKKQLDSRQRFFKKVNALETEWQVINRGVLHHNTLVFNPCYEMFKLNKPVREINFMYGFLNTYFIGKIMQVSGSFSLGSMMRIAFSFYVFYVLAAFFISRKMFADIKYVFINTAAAVISCLGTSYFYIVLAVGYNPMRHFFDIFVAFFLYMYVKGNEKKYIFIALFFAMLSIGINPHFGIFISGGLFLTLGIKYLLEKNKTDIVVSALIPALAVPVYVFSNVGAQASQKYFLYGMAGFPVSPSVVLAIMSVIFAAYVLSAYFRKAVPEKRYTALFFLFYLQGALFYYITCPQKDHFMPLFVIAAFTVSAFLSMISENISAKSKNFIFTLVAAVFLCIFLSDGRDFVKSKRKFDTVFKNHVTYKWDLPNTDFISTMNPDFFAGSKALIEKYSQNENSVSMISMYDLLLLLITDKYNNLYNNDIANALVTRDEIDKIKERFDLLKPQYLFADKDMKRRYGQDIISPQYMNVYTYNESLWRVLRLESVKEVFDYMIGDYEPAESSELITVYKRKN